MKTKPTLLLSTIFFLWMTFLLAAFFVIQKPTWSTVIYGVGYLFLTILVWVLFIASSITLGYFLLDSFSNLSQKIFLAIGLGMGVWGLIGFAFVLLRLTNKYVFLFSLIIVLFFTRKRIKNFWSGVKTAWNIFIRSTKYIPKWIPLFAFAFFSFSFLLALAPPIEAFDGLFYHLTVPTWWLQDGIQLVNMPHYWFPALMEGMFLFPLAFGLDSTPQLIHWTFAFLTLGLVFNWAQTLFGFRSAWWSIALSLSMPSLFWLASWAYTDIGLTFYSVASLIALVNWKKDFTNRNWLILSAIFCGFAIGIKYTAVMLPVTCCLILLFWLRNDLKKLITNLSYFSSFVFFIGGIWYIRNWIWVKNPFYPFVFGGIFWDEFRANWYSGAGSGIGWDLVELLLLPFVTTFGTQDRNFFDGRIGPFYLILFPLVIYSLFVTFKYKTRQLQVVYVISLFGILGVALWIFGVIQTQNLMQSRLLFPALLVLLPLFGKSFAMIRLFNTTKFNFQFIVSTVLAFTVFAFLLDFALLVIYRNPVFANINVNSRYEYTQKFNNTYAELLKLSEQTSKNAFVYLINEPRSYGINRSVQPDPINENLPHDMFLYSTNVEIISAWKKLGYTHIIMRTYMFDTEIENQHLSPRFDELRQMLIEVDNTENYILFEIP